MYWVSICLNNGLQDEIEAWNLSNEEHSWIHYLKVLCRAEPHCRSLISLPRSLTPRCFSPRGCSNVASSHFNSRFQRPYCEPGCVVGQNHWTRTSDFPASTGWLLFKLVVEMTELDRCLPCFTCTANGTLLDFPQYGCPPLLLPEVKTLLESLKMET